MVYKLQTNFPVIPLRPPVVCREIDLELPAAASLSSGNPLQNVLDMEKVLFSTETATHGEEIIGSIISTARSQINPAAAPAAKLSALFHILRDQFLIRYQENDFILGGLAHNPPALDCDNLAYLYAAVAYELNWPVEIVTVDENRHTFIRWSDSTGHYINFETTSGEFLSDSLYQQHFVTQRLAVRDTTEKIMADLYVTRGYYYFHAGNLAAAQNDFTQAAELDPTLGDPRYELGNIEYERGHYTAALDYYLGANTVCPDSLDYYYGIANCHYMLGDYNEAIAAYNQVKQIDPENSEVNFYLALCYYQLHDLDTARTIIQGIIQQHPEYAPAREFQNNYLN